jgi:hypothetical protein
MVCFTPGQVGAPDRIVQEYCRFVEAVFQADYCGTKGGCFQFKRPSNGGTDFFDEPTETTRCRFLGEFLRAHHPALDVDFVVQVCESRKKAVDPGDEDNEPFPVPDIITHTPGRMEFYEIKPRNSAGRHDANDKLARFLAMRDFLKLTAPTLAYERGTKYKPDFSLKVYEGPLGPSGIFGFGRISLHFVGEGGGVLLHEICVDSPLLSEENIRLLIAILLALLVIFLARKGLRGPLPEGLQPTPALASWTSPLTGGVGAGRPNLGVDVRYVQLLLNDWHQRSQIAEIAVDGILGGETVGAISQFQNAVFGTSDGAVDIGHFTMRTLEEDHFRSLDDQIADSDISQFNEHNLDTLADYPQLETEVLAELTATADAYLRHLHERA